MVAVVERTMYVSNEEYTAIRKAADAEGFTDRPVPMFNRVNAILTGYDVVIAPEWPQKIERDDGWMAASLNGAAMAWNPEAMRHALERLTQGVSVFPPVHDQIAATVADPSPRLPGAFW